MADDRLALTGPGAIAFESIGPRPVGLDSGALSKRVRGAKFRQGSGCHALRQARRMRLRAERPWSAA
jgi:hypothetical protein